MERQKPGGLEKQPDGVVRVSGKNTAKLGQEEQTEKELE